MPGIVVTGASGYLASQLTRELLTEGLEVLAVASTELSLSELSRSVTYGRERLKLLQADLTLSSQIERIKQEVLSLKLEVSGWVNAASTSSGGGLLFDLDSKQLDLATQSLGRVIEITDLAAQIMRSQGKGGSIVNITSMYGMVSPDFRVYRTSPKQQNPPAYGAVKAGIIQFSRYAATHLSQYGIRVNSLSPGPFPSPDNQDDEEFVSELVSRTPLGRLGLPTDFSAAVRFLLSESSSFVTGTNLIVDGGWTAW